MTRRRLEAARLLYENGHDPEWAEHMSPAWIEVACGTGRIEVALAEFVHDWNLLEKIAPSELAAAYPRRYHVIMELIR